MYKRQAVDKEHFKNISVNDSYKDLTLYNAINLLEDDLRTTTILFYFEDMKYKDIAKDLNVKELNVKEDGCVYKNAAGTYVHGIFENNEFAEQFLRLIYRRKGLSFEDRRRVDIEEYKRRQYDRLADAVRENLDMKEIYRMIGL